jgi:hypothetical protein
MIARVKSGRASALVSDSTQVILRAKNDPTCSLHVLDAILGTFDIGFAFRKNFTAEHPGFVDSVSQTLLRFNEAGELKVCFCILRLAFKETHLALLPHHIHVLNLCSIEVSKQS